MSYKLNGSNIEGNVVVVDNTSGVTIGKNGSLTLFNFSNKYKPIIGPSIYSKTNIGYKINDVDQGTYLSPFITVYNTANQTVYPTLKSSTRKILCICLGGGAGGTGGNYKEGNDTESGGGGSGGGGGGLAWVLYKVNGGESTTITVGAGGAGGNEDDPIGKVGTKGGDTTFLIGSTTICTGTGGNPGVKSNSNNAGSTSGAAVSGEVISNSNVLASGTVTGLVGGNGQNDPDENGELSQNGFGGAGGNGGSTSYPYGKSGDQTSNTINPLSFSGGQFLSSTNILDPNNSGFTYNDFCGINANTENVDALNYGRGGQGGNGEGRANGASQNGWNGKGGFCVIVQYGLE